MTVPVPADPDSDPARDPVRTPWLCPYCGYDARGRAIGDPCAECGVPLGEASFLPMWLDGARLSRMRRAATVGALCGLAPILVLVAWPVAATVVPVDLMAWVFLALLATTAIGLLGQSFAAARIAVPGLAAGRAFWIRVGAWARPLVVVAMLVAILGLDRLESVTDGGLGVAVEALFVVLYFTLPALCVGGDLLLGAMFAGIRREARVAAPVWHVALSTFRTILVVVSYPLALFPFLGWIAGPLVWSILTGIAFALLRRDLAVAATRPRA